MYISKKLLAIAAASLLGSAFAFPASAETISGQLEHAGQDSIRGWVWDKDDYNHILNVELHIFPVGSKMEIATLTAKADRYRDDLQTSIGDGYHGFSCPINWDTLKGEEFSVTAYAVAEQGKVALEETLFYRKVSIVSPKADSVVTQPSSAPAATVGIGPGTDAAAPLGPGMSGMASTGPGVGASTSVSGPSKASPSPSASQAASSSTSSTAKKPSAYSGKIGPGMPRPTPVEDTVKKGASLGIFTTSGYCSCSLCSAGGNLTYSGTTPQANHTIAADINLLPLQTKVIIHDVVYTVEDIGSSVNGNRIDIFYDSHEDALAHGIEEVEVFLVEE